MELSSRLKLIKPSATMVVNEKATALKLKGIDLIDFGAGEPDFDTPESIKNAAEAALRAGQTKYTPVGGTDALKTAILAKLKRDNGLDYAKNEVVASCGGKHSLFVAFQALFGDGDEVIVPAPYWVSYPDMLLLAGAKARIVSTKEENDFKLTAGELDAAFTAKTKAIIFNSPSNPAGVAYNEEELSGLLDVIARRDCMIISDDVYEKMVYGDFKLGQVLRLRPDLRERTLICNSVSKTYAMTGWRIGYAAGPAALIKAMTTLQGQMTSNPSSVAQAGAAQALGGPQESVPLMMGEFAKRRDFVVERLRKIPGVRCPKPQGAFYVFPNIEAHLNPAKGLKTGDDLAGYLIEEAHVAVVGGTDFGYPGHIRISYATSMQNLERGLERIEKALGKLAAN
ncbi:MAG TPA: pyridoxal phosphate-dependent aminotransferase [Candidatus Acidoferrales bacterium]|nr:pyridoxal phosphate-dependent aminotransferase [Candidatus Acidoferrales bacterium]